MLLFYTLALTGQLLSRESGDVKSIGKYLQSHGASEGRANTVARRIVQQADRWDADPALIAAIVSVENPRLVSKARSSAGAIGVMQVMPFWKRSFAQRCGNNLADDATNICFGIQILNEHLRQRGGNLRRALMSYNGCRTTSRCGHYPRWVLGRHERLIGTLAMNLQ